MKIKVRWVTDGEPVNDLPEIVEVPADIDEEEISDWLSDEYGFLHDGWEEL